MLPSDRTVVVERFRDEIGDWRLCVLSPFGGARARGLGAGARRRACARALGLGGRCDLVGRRDRAPPARRRARRRRRSWLLIEPDEVEELVVGELGETALFGARFRENAARALLIPRAYPGSARRCGSSG